MKFGLLVKKVCRRILRLSKLNRIIYKLAHNEIVDFDNQMVIEARKFLEDYSPDPQTSCITENEITPKVDIHIIVPAYNVGDYIEECMNSIVENPTQKYTYLVTVINDGSTDNTPSILAKYETNPCVEIIHQANKGFSGARNTGLKHIKGKYILFVDSDDLMDWSGVERMMDIAMETNADIVSGSHTLITDNGKYPRFFKVEDGVLSTNQLRGQPWAKLFRSELFRDVCYPEHYWYEDSIFAQIIYPRISLVYGISNNTYYYRNRQSGITNQGIKKPKSIDSYWITERLFEERSAYGLKTTKQYYDYILHMVELTFSRIRFQPYDVKKSVFILFCDFIEKHFADYSTENNKYKEIEKILKQRNLGKCIAFAKWM